LGLTSPADACPACKDTVAGGDASSEVETLSGGAAGGVPGGFNTSIYFMLGIFIGTLGLVGHTMYRGTRGRAKSDRRGDAKDDQKK
jgi:hypothetical protein